MHKALPITVVTFDLDDTLWHVDPVIEQAEKTVYAWLQQQAPRLTAQFSFEALVEWRINIYRQQTKLSHQISQLRLESISKALETSGYPTEEAQRLSALAFEVFIQARHQVTFFDTVVPLLKQLHGRYQLGALSNGNADIFKLEHGHFFDFAFSAEQLNASKPAPDQFLAACAHTGADETQLVHVGDNLEHDIVGANNAGCHSIWFNPDGNTKPEGSPTPSAEVRCLSEIPAAIDHIKTTRTP